MYFESNGVLRPSISLDHLPVTCACSKVVPKLATSHDADPFP